MSPLKKVKKENRSSFLCTLYILSYWAHFFKAEGRPHHAILTNLWNSTKKKKLFCAILATCTRRKRGHGKRNARNGKARHKKSPAKSERKLDDAAKNRYNKASKRNKRKGENRYGQQTHAVHPAGRYLPLQHRQRAEGLAQLRLPLHPRDRASPLPRLGSKRPGRQPGGRFQRLGSLCHAHGTRRGRRP